VHYEDYEMFGGCSLLVAVGAMEIWFELDRGGETMLVGPLTTELPETRNDWQPVITVLDFIDNRIPEYHGPDYVDDRIATSEAEKQSLEKLMDFYSREYPSRKEEFSAWYSEAARRFLHQVDAYYSAKRQSAGNVMAE
jgi:hypothetical protein